MLLWISVWPLISLLVAALCAALMHGAELLEQDGTVPPPGPVLSEVTRPHPSTCRQRVPGS